MKINVALVLPLSVFCLVANARITYELSVNGAIAKVNFKVVDQDGVVVPDAKVWGAFTAPHLKDSILVDGMTNTNGEFVAQGNCDEFLRVDVTKEGYYHTEAKINFWLSKEDPIVVNGKWQPYGETRTVVLKKIRNPVEMVEAPYRVSKAISYGKWYGYDMVRADWMPPYGEGESMDVLVRLGLKAVNDTSDFRTTMELCFTNNPHAGVYKVSKDNWSEMKSIYRADTNAVYKSDISFVFERHPRMPIVDTRLSENSCLVFRIRTKVDACGKLISAHYGKIYGLWSFFGAMTSPELFFNPTPNDTNLEDAETARKSRLAYKQQIEFERRRKAQGK